MENRREKKKMTLKYRYVPEELDLISGIFPELWNLPGVSKMGEKNQVYFSKYFLK